MRAAPLLHGTQNLSHPKMVMHTVVALERVATVCVRRLAEKDAVKGEIVESDLEVDLAALFNAAGGIAKPPTTLGISAGYLQPDSGAFAADFQMDLPRSWPR